MLDIENTELPNAPNGYDFRQTVEFTNFMDTRNRRNNLQWVYKALETADIPNAIVTEDTYEIIIDFSTKRDLIHFDIAHDMPMQFFSVPKASDYEQVKIDFISLKRKKQTPPLECNDADAIFRAFKVAAEKSGTTTKIDFDTVKNTYISVTAPDPRDYFKFWKVVPTPLKNTLYPINYY